MAVSLGREIKGREGFWEYLIFREAGLEKAEGRMKNEEKGTRDTGGTLGSSIKHSSGHFFLSMNRNAELWLGTNRGPEFQRAEPVLGVPTLRFMASMLVRLGRSKLPMNPNRRLTPALSSVRAGAEVSKSN